MIAVSMAAIGINANLVRQRFSPPGIAIALICSVAQPGEVTYSLVELPPIAARRANPKTTGAERRSTRWAFRR